MAAQSKKLSDVEQAQEAREYVLVAVSMLKPLGPEYARVAWMLEDSLEYLEELEGSEEFLKSPTNIKAVPLGASASKVVNGRS